MNDLRPLFWTLFVLIFISCQSNQEPVLHEHVTIPDMPELTESVAADFVDLSLHCVDRPYPYKIGYRFPSEEWVKPHTEVHPSFYGCWDWHSAVHGHWAMVKVLKTFPEIDKKDSIRIKLRNNLTQENLTAEYDFFANQSFTKGFERTYGWAWLLKLYAELATWKDEEGQQWKQNMKPLAELLSQKTSEYLQALSSPLRPGTHANTAFSFGLMMEYAETVKDDELLNAMKAFSEKHFRPDKNCPTAYEPSGTDFISPCLAEAALMSKLMPTEMYLSWFQDFLPSPGSNEIQSIENPPAIYDKEDPSIGHLIGLMFQRAWCLKQIAAVFGDTDPRKEYFLKIALKHIEAGESIMFESGYGGAHWLATFAIYAYTIEV
ncbi:MAG: DUF2891 domain-containing protein [Cytophagales bacterium]|nr:DUF2891 domain-containing protein [Cytophagales bacterium]